MGKKNKVNIIDTDNIVNINNSIITDQKSPLLPDLQPAIIEDNIIDNILNNIIKENEIVTKLSPKCKDKHIINTNPNLIQNLNQNLNLNNTNIDKNSNTVLKQKIKTKNKDDKSSTDFLKELLTNQLKNINPSKRLNYNDIKRISKFLSSSIFDPNQCSLWTGYITNEKNQSKGTYINFYFNQKKIALHRLLYLNFIGDIINTEYLKFSCPNKGKCCNIHHLKKYSYNSIIPQNVANKPNLVDNTVHINRDKESLSVEL